jgi:hypothetical protein
MRQQACSKYVVDCDKNGKQEITFQTSKKVSVQKLQLDKNAEPA